MQAAASALVLPSLARLCGAATIDAALARAGGPTSPSPNGYGVFLETGPRSTVPHGWMREMLTRQLDGLARHHAASGYPYDTCLWAGRIVPPDHGEAWWPYEQTGYLLDGLERLGLVTGNASILREPQANLRYVLGHPAADGSLGPGHIGKINWPHAVYFRALLVAYDATGDAAIATAMAGHYKARPEDFGHGYRDSANVEEMVRLYNISAGTDILALARRTYANFDNTHPKTGLAHLCDNEPILEHGVTFNETAKLPAILYMATGDRAMLDASVNAYRKIDRDHMLASGLHSAEETLCGNDPGLYHETCNVSDYTWSVGYLLMATGDAEWADRLEKAVYNAGLGSVTKDFKAHQYFSSPNQVVARHGLVTNYNVDRVAYRPGHDTECCSGNVHRFLPNFVLRQWMRTRQGGVVAALYGASTHKTTVQGVAIGIEQRTEYPFSDSINFVLTCSRPVAFPLHLRIPGWTAGASIAVNDKPWPGLCQPASFETVYRTFRSGDTIRLHLPMPVRMRTWPQGAVSLERGPLVFALKIEEAATPVFGYKTTTEFPAWDILPASPWNYGMQAKQFDLAGQVKVVERRIAGCPWDAGNSPVELQAPARRIASWTLSEKTNPSLPTTPEASSDVELITLVPYGSTRIRLTAFPILA